VSGSGTAAVILDPIPDENKENAWEFLKWWTSAEIQLRFNSNVEAILGVTSRRAASNREAVINMQWDPQMLETILSQWDMVEEVPEVPGSYYSSRAVDQSFWNVMNANENPKEMLLKWGKIADAELERKGAQYGY
jgi:ABC-type glycerol-3-phosphate transport system substrate-binding protein